MWILSAYGAGRDPPLQLFGGYPREQSFEEVRLHHYQLAASGNEQQAIQDVQNLVSNAEQQMQTALNDVDGAIKYIVNGEKEHPNRIDTCIAKGGSTAQIQTSSGSQQPTSALSQPSAFGRPSAISTAPQSTTSAFGRPTGAFGQPSAPVSAFDQPSSIGQQPTAFAQPSGFGQPSQLGRPSTSFGQPSSAFGQPSSSAPIFGQASAPSAFGRNPQQTSAFGAPSALGANQQIPPFAKPANPFAAPSAPAQQGVFGQPSVPAASESFAKAPATTSALGQPAVATAAPPVLAFGQPSQVQPSAFGQAQGSQTSGAFGQASNQTTSSAFSNPNTASVSGGSQKHATRNARGDLTSWNGKPVIYVDEEPFFKRSDGGLEKIWFPKGPPPFKKELDLPDEVYDDATKENYMYMKQHGAFKDGIMPVLPPKREWVDWDF